MIMRKYLILTLLLSVLGFSPLFAKADKQVVVLSCDIHCQGCIDKIMKNIAFEKGVKDIVCDLPSKTVTVTYDANKTDTAVLLSAFEKIGKPAKVKEPAAKSPKEPKGTPSADAASGASPQY
ncbi:MAG: cation transporter [Paludibacteraceae bacterium]|nr:cation transporter [Paludibacteraceae bacterium]